MIGADHKFVGVRHDLVAISRFASRTYRKCTLAMVALSILVGTIALLALERGGMRAIRYTPDAPGLS